MAAGIAAVFDASPLIARWQIGLLDRIAPLFDEWLIPPAVAAEVAPSVGTPAWVTVQLLGQPIDSRILRANLGAGETEALALALEIKPERLVLDDRQARHLGVSLGLPVIGAVGVLLDAKRAGLVRAVRPNLVALRRVNFHMSPQIMDQVLDDANEPRLRDDRAPR